MGFVDESIRAVFFDAVGTLLLPWPDPIEVYLRAAAAQGVVLSGDEVRRRFRAAFQDEEEFDRRAGWRVDEIRERQRWRRIVSKSLPEVSDQERCFRELWDHFSRPSAWQARAGSADVLGELAHRGLVLGIASNFDARLNAILADIPDLAPVRQHCVVSSLVGWRKPAQQFFEAVTIESGFPAESILFVGDHVVNDLEGARSAGLRAVLFDPECKSHSTERVTSFSELL